MEQIKQIRNQWLGSAQCRLVRKVLDCASYTARAREIMWRGHGVGYGYGFGMGEGRIWVVVRNSDNGSQKSNVFDLIVHFFCRFLVHRRR